MRKTETKDHSRDPCPYVIVADVGIGFSMGAIGGTFWHGFKGFRNAPRGERFAGMLTSIKARAPVIGGNFAVWSGMFNAGDCFLAGLRGKEDHWNSIMSGALTGGLLAVRSGPRAMIASSIFGGIILAAMEGVGIMINRMSADSYKPQAPIVDVPTNPASTESGASAGEAAQETPINEKRGFKFF